MGHGGGIGLHTHVIYVQLFCAFEPTLDFGRVVGVCGTPQNNSNLEQHLFLPKDWNRIMGSKMNRTVHQVAQEDLKGVVVQIDVVVLNLLPVDFADVKDVLDSGVFSNPTADRCSDLQQFSSLLRHVS